MRFYTYKLNTKAPRQIDTLDAYSVSLSSGPEPNDRGSQQSVQVHCHFLLASDTEISKSNGNCFLEAPN